MPRRGFALNRWLLRESKSKRICITVIPYCFDRRSLPASSPSSFAPTPACVRGARCRAPAGAQTGIIKSVIISVKLMKKLLQLVALAAVGVLAFQPALSSVACVMGTPASVPSAPRCAMAMSPMGMRCQMPPHVSGTGCQQDCSQCGMAKSFALSSAGAKPKAGKAQLFLPMPMMAQVAIAHVADEPPGTLIASSPPRYILFQVFRI